MLLLLCQVLEVLPLDDSRVHAHTVLVVTKDLILLVLHHVV